MFLVTKACWLTIKVMGLTADIGCSCWALGRVLVEINLLHLWKDTAILLNTGRNRFTGPLEGYCGRNRFTWPLEGYW